MSNSITPNPQVVHTIYQPSQLNPSSICLDMANAQNFSGIVNGSIIDSYLLQIKDINNNLLYTSSPITTIPYSNTGIKYVAADVVPDSYSNWNPSTVHGEIIDSSFDDIKYIGTGWTANNKKDNNVFYDGSTYYSNTTGDYIEYTFTNCTGISYNIWNRKDGGIALIYLDNTLVKTIDTYGSGNQPFGYSGLNPTINHTIKIVVDGTKNVASTDYFIEFDYFIVGGDELPIAQVSPTANSYLTFSFFGSAINAYFRTTPDSGLAEIYIDNVLMTTIDCSSASITPTVQLYSNLNLSEASHKIEILVTGNSNNTFNQYVYFEKFEVFTKTSLLEYVDDSDTSIVYTGSDWKVGIQGFVPFYDNDVHNSSNTDDAMQYSFTGTDIFCYFTQGEDKGIMQVYLDGSFVENIDTYAVGQAIYDGNNPQWLAYSATGLANTGHTVRFVVTGTKNAASTGTRIEFDYFKINNNGTNYLYDGDTLSITVPANSVTLRGGMKWQLTYWNSDNNNESVSSSETIFTNMTTPVVSLNLPDTITSRSYDFTAQYSQQEKVKIKDWDMQLYEKSYQVNCGVFGQKFSGTAIDCGDWDTDGTLVANRYHINCGTF